MRLNIKDKLLLTLQSTLEPLEYVYALWLEGADATGSMDEYSDIDIYVDVEDDMENIVWQKIEHTLNQVSNIDYRYTSKHNQPKLRQNVYHLQGTSEFFMIDFNMQLHSRHKDEFIYLEGDTIEAVKIIFDKTGVIQYRTYQISDDQDFFRERIQECKYRYTQHSRVLKYILRGHFAEAYMYYNRYVLEPLVTLLRIKYTPAHVDYFMIHITHHLPHNELIRLNHLIEGISLKNMKFNMVEARLWFEELLEDSKIKRWISN